MNKLIKMTLFTTLSFITLTGCSTGNPQNDLLQENDSQGISTNEDGESFTQNQVVYFGKVKTVVGNEIELELAKEPFSEDDEEPKSEEEAGGSMAAATLTPSSTATSIENLPKMELEYTGETKSMTLPAGVSIMNKGVEGDLSAIKEGSVVMIIASENGEDPIISSVNIWE